MTRKQSRSYRYLLQTVEVVCEMKPRQLATSTSLYTDTLSTHDVPRTNVMF